MTSRPRLLLATAALATLALTACSSDTSASDPADGTTASDTASDTASSAPSGTTSPSPTDTPTTDPTTSEGESDTVAVPVFYVGDTPQGPRLFREFRQVGAADPLGEAADLVASGKALDPDYRTLWPAGGFQGVALDEQAGRIVLTLAEGGSPDEAVRMTPRQARLAVQQMVWTLQGVTQTRDPLVVETADGTPTSLFGIDTTDGVGNAKELKVLALVNITAPAQGATVSGSFTATGLSSSFEGTTAWDLLAPDGTVVKSGSAQAAEAFLDKLAPWTTEIDLSGVAPDDYTFVARTDDPTGGTEGPGPTEDTKAVTVR